MSTRTSERGPSEGKPAIGGLGVDEPILNLAIRRVGKDEDRRSPLQLAHLEQARPDLFGVDARCVPQVHEVGVIKVSDNEIGVIADVRRQSNLFLNEADTLTLRTGNDVPGKVHGLRHQARIEGRLLGVRWRVFGPNGEFERIRHSSVCWNGDWVVRTTGNIRRPRLISTPYFPLNVSHNGNRSLFRVGKLPFELLSDKDEAGGGPSDFISLRTG